MIDLLVGPVALGSIHPMKLSESLFLWEFFNLSIFGRRLTPMAHALPHKWISNPGMLLWLRHFLAKPNYKGSSAHPTKPVKVVPGAKFLPFLGSSVFLAKPNHWPKRLIRMRVNCLTLLLSSFKMFIISVYYFFQVNP